MAKRLALPVGVAVVIIIAADGVGGGCALAFAFVVADGCSFGVASTGFSDDEAAVAVEGSSCTASHLEWHSWHPTDLWLPLSKNRHLECLHSSGLQLAEF